MSASSHALIVTFRTTHAALRAERAFLDKGYAIELIPVPRGISSDCGFCVKAALPDECRTRGAAFDGEEPCSSMMAMAAELSFEAVWMETKDEVAATEESHRKEKRYERIDTGH
ncbi:MAG: DUF3343 domain-containing protein [Rectinemataceae bacterium]